LFFNKVSGIALGFTPISSEDVLLRVRIIYKCILCIYITTIRKFKCID